MTPDKEQLEKDFIRGCAYFRDWLAFNENKLTEEESLFLQRLRRLIHIYSPRPGEKYCKKCLYYFPIGAATAQEH